MDVITGPAPAASTSAAPQTRYWIDPTGRLLEFQADLPASTVSILLDAAGYQTVPAAAVTS